MSTGARAAFVDRDGVINVDYGYVYRIDQFELLPGVSAALRRLREAGFLLIVVTNQSGIARGLYTESDYESLTEYLRGLLDRDGVQLDGVYHCPHLPDAAVPAYRCQCNCRKPKPGMILRGIEEFGIDRTRSIMIGDNQTDIQAARAAGIRWCCLVTQRGAHDTDADILAPDLAQGVETFLGLL